MSKSPKSAAATKVAGARPDLYDAAFRQIQDDLNTWLSTLRCAVTVIEGSEVTDQSLAARASSVVQSCTDNLERIERELENWALHYHAEAVSHG